MFKNKTVVIGVSGGIASYKAAWLASALSKTEADVHVIMTENACKFISPITFETLTGNVCLTDTFQEGTGMKVPHIDIAQKADLIIIAPATANTIAKIAGGIADNMLTSVILAATCPVTVVPAMNTHMYENPATQINLEILSEYGYNIVEPATGRLACDVVGKGKMPEPEYLFELVEKEIGREKDMEGMKVLVTAGATRESMDPVRFITNHSSGKMGFAIAKEAVMRGADVTIVKASTTAKIPEFAEIVSVESCEDMYREVMNRAEEMDIIIKAAAVSDYTPLNTSSEKMKKKDGDLNIPLKRTKDILAAIGEIKREDQFICGFSMETENMVENSLKKLKKKNADMIVANNLKEEGSGFGTDTNGVTLITGRGVEKQPMMSKQQVAGIILDRIMEKYTAS